MRRFTGHSNDKWGKFLDVKINAPDILEKQLKKKKIKGVVLIGSVTDAYQPIEKKYEITRDILKILLKYQISISILTKSKLICRDIDLFKQFKNCSIGVSISTLDANIRKLIEPNSSSSIERIESLTELKNNKINTYAFIGPIIPYITDVDNILNKIQYIVDSVWFESLNTKCGNKKDLKIVLDEIDTNLFEKVIQTTKDVDYWNKLERNIRETCFKMNIPITGFYRH